MNLLESFGIQEVIINVHYLADQITDYINNKKFNLNINIVEEKSQILDTGGGVLNAIKYFSNEPFLIINPDTVWSPEYLSELRKMEKKFFKNKKNKCMLLLVDKIKSFDPEFDGDFSLENNLINKKNKKYIYIGFQIIKPEVFSNLNKKVFSINQIWDQLIEKDELLGIESNVNFLHVSNLEIYEKLIKKF